jgi:hypothetical protein
MNDNTILRIKVPAHLYESVKKQLTLTEAKKGGKTYGDWTVVKEKKAPKDGMKKVEEMKDGKKDRSLDELKAVKEKLEKKINEMENAPKDGVKEGEVSESIMSSVIDAIQGNPEEFIQSLKVGLNMSTNEFQNFLAGLGTLGTVGTLAAKAAIKDKKANQQAGSMEEAKEEEKKPTNELFGFGSKGKYKEGDLVYFKLQGEWETSPRKISRVFKGGDGKIMYDLSTHETNGAYLKNGGYNTTEDNLKPAK